MKAENVLYTDGHDVTVTESMFQVKKKWYHLSGITKHTFMILQPDRFPCVILLLLGGVLEIVGAANVIPSTWLLQQGEIKYQYPLPLYLVLSRC